MIFELESKPKTVNIPELTRQQSVHNMHLVGAIIITSSVSMNKQTLVSFPRANGQKGKGQRVFLVPPSESQDSDISLVNRANAFLGHS